MAPRRQGSHPQSTSLNCRFGSPVRNAFSSRLSPPHTALPPPGPADKVQGLGPSRDSAGMSLPASVNGPLMDLEREKEARGEERERGRESKWHTSLDGQPPVSPEAALFDSLDHSGWRDIPLDDDDDDDEPLDAEGTPAATTSGGEARGKAGHKTEQEASLLFLMQLQSRGNASPSPSPSASLAHSPAHFGLQPLAHSASEPPLSMQQRASAVGGPGSPCSSSHLTLSRSADHRKEGLSLSNSMWLTDSPPPVRPFQLNACGANPAQASGPASAPPGGLSAWDLRMASQGAESRQWCEDEGESCAMVVQSPVSASAMDLDLDPASTMPCAAATTAALAGPTPAALACKSSPLEGDSPLEGGSSTAAEERQQGQVGEGWHPALPAPPTGAPLSAQGASVFVQGFWRCPAGTSAQGPVPQTEGKDGGEGTREGAKTGEGKEEAMDESEPAPGVPRGRPRTPRPRPRQTLLSGVWGVASGLASKESSSGRRKDSLLPTIHEGSAVLAPQRLVPSQPLEAQLSPSLAALLSVLSTDYDTERHSPAPHASLGEPSTTSEGGANSNGSGASSSSSSGSGSGSGSGGGGAPGSKSVPHSPRSAALASRQLEVTPSLSALLSILSVDSESEGHSPPKPRALHPIRSMGTGTRAAELELELECRASSGLTRQCSLDSGIHWLERERQGSPPLEPSPTGSLHSSPAQSPLRAHDSSLHSTPSPVLQRRLTGNRVSVYEECWQAGPERKASEAEPSSLRSVCEVLETQGTAAFYRGFKLEAPPNGRGMKRTKVQDA